MASCDPEADDVLTGEEIISENYVPKTLKEMRARQTRLTPADCVSIGVALTRALSHLHHNGLVHRDIKPSNVIFVHGVPKLADIGLVSSFDATMSFVGTAGYFPPEGPGKPTGDIYSLGIVLFHALAARVPYAADSPISITVNHLNDPLPLEYLYSKGIPQPIEQVALKMTAKSPSRQKGHFMVFWGLSAL